MGRRLHVAIGYGILVEHADDRTWFHECQPSRQVKKFLEKLDDKALKSKERGKIDDEVKYYSAMHARHLVMVLESDDVSDNDDAGTISIEEIIDEIFIAPSKYGGPRSFLGYVENVHDNDPVDYAWTYAARVDTGEPFEVHVPVERDDHMFTSIEIDGKKWYVPQHTGITMEKHVDERHVDGKKFMFESREEAVRSISSKLKRKGTATLLYEFGLDMVQLFYPDKTIDDIERYIVGWWE